MKEAGIVPREKNPPSERECPGFFVRRPRGWLDDEDVLAADVLVDLNPYFTVGKTLHLGLAERHSEASANLLGERPIGVS